MSEIRTISEVMQELKEHRNAPQIVKDWREMLPEGSRWFPGCPGKPDCRVCEGTGYLRIEGLRVGHPLFGKLVLCDCTAGRVATTKAKEYDANNLRPMPEYLR